MKTKNQSNKKAKTVKKRKKSPTDTCFTDNQILWNVSGMF